ncbi:hypothetical protein FH972_006566 [Carpinus fangiana]|uniref:MIF4G domain-containing protein n=1 Tax=Carpinus fangiana TaxID=176857 RepID=A0A5N6QTP5_9ROSI|nr:hypothetical protein FH972_006566 [Carpinus fangiana]
MVATLSTCMKDVSSVLLQMLEEEFNFLINKKDQMNIETKIRNIRFIGELCKFKIAPAGLVFSCLKACLDDFTHHNIDGQIHLIASLTAGLSRYHDEFAVAVVDEKMLVWGSYGLLECTVYVLKCTTRHFRGFFVHVQELLLFCRYPQGKVQLPIDPDVGSEEMVESVKAEKKRKQMEAVAEDLFNNEQGRRHGVAGSLLVHHSWCMRYLFHVIILMAAEMGAQLNFNDDSGSLDYVALCKHVAKKPGSKKKNGEVMDEDCIWSQSPATRHSAASTKAHCKQYVWMPGVFQFTILCKAASRTYNTTRKRNIYG